MVLEQDSKVRRAANRDIRRISVFGLVFLMCFGTSFAFQPTDVPARVRDDSPWWAGSGYWDRRHAAKLREIASGPKEYDFVFLGDSITQNWEGWSDPIDLAVVERAYKTGLLKFPNGPGRRVYEEMKCDYALLNLGVSGDKTQHVLWRLEHGELDGYRTKGVMLMVGANNTDGTPEDVARGIRAILKKIGEKQPQAKVLLLPVFPADDHATSPARVRHREISRIIRTFADGERIVWCDFTDRFLEGDGAISPETMSDYLHPTEKGYRIWREGIEPYLRRMLKRDPAAAPAPWHLTCERVVSPTGVDAARPRLSWRLPEGWVRQAAYEIEADGWRSGRVASAECVDVPWGGGPIPSSARVSWRVRVWDGEGRASAWSAHTFFVAGIRRPQDWGEAKWIGGADATRPEVDFSRARWIAGKTFVRRFAWSGEGPCDLALFATEPFRVTLNGAEVLASGGHVYDGRFLRRVDLMPKLAVGTNELKIVLRDVGDPSAVANVWSAGASALVGVLRRDRRCFLSTDESWGGEDVGAFRAPDFARALDAHEERATPAFMRRFAVRDGLKRAVLHVTGLGCYEARVNGARVGDKVLDPAPTDYDDRVLYSTFEIGDRLKVGENALELLLGHGWYDMRSVATWNFDGAPWRAAPRALARLELDYADGSRETVVTDGSWEQVDSPVVYDCLREGEVTGCRPDDAHVPSGTKATVVSAPCGRLEGETMPGTKVQEVLAPAKVDWNGRGRAIVTFPKAVSGWARLAFRGLRKGDVVAIRYDENLKPDGSPTDPLRPCPGWDWNANDRLIDMFVSQCGSRPWLRTGSGMQTDHFVSSGVDGESHEPRFVWHGFRHLVVTGLREPLRAEDVRAVAVRTDFPETGSFACSDATLNGLVELARQSYRVNFTTGCPTDCPHREKLGWTGDAWIASEMAQYYFENTAAYEKWLRDVIDTQRPSGEICCIAPTSGWGFAWGNGPAFDAVLAMLPWNLWMYRGDRLALETAYGPLAKYLAYAQTRECAPDLVAHGLGDWNARVEVRKPSDELVASCLYLRMREIAAEFARVLGRTDEATAFDEAATRSRLALRAKYVRPDGTVDNGEQTAQALAVVFGLADDAAVRARVGERLVAAVERHGRHIDFGLVGAKYVFRALSEIGRTDLALAMLTNPTEPTMVRWLGPDGTGCLWEDFDKGLSKCHIMLGDFAAWLPQTLAGIRPAAPGFRKIRFAPQPVESLTWAKAATESPYGRIAADWTLSEGRFTYRVEVPAGCTGEVVLPDGSRTEVGPGERTFTTCYERNNP